jgi:hypothetical protein
MQHAIFRGADVSLALVEGERPLREKTMNISTQVARRKAPRQADAMRALVQNSCLALAALALTGCSELASAQVLPTDAKPLCSFEAGEFPGWFATGAVTLNGAVKPKDSLNFAPETPPGNRACNFHKWAEQMFLWLTSPAGGGRVFQSPDFYRVSARGDDGMRTLEKNTTRKNNPSVRASKPPEPGQPGNRFVLMAGNKSLVYYATYVNEVYAYFLTGTKTGGITPQPTRFPIEKPELEQIIAFGKDRGMTITDIDDPKARALAVTVKSAWVEITGPEADKYITVMADIPEYTSDELNETLTPSGKTKTARLALVGMHIVGSASQNRQMIWATFEHINNVPMASYPYMSTTSEQPKTADPDPTGRWLFSASSCTGSPNVARVHARNAPIIKALEGKKIEPSDTCRVNAWGVHPDDELLERSKKNTQVIAINSSVIGMLPVDDVRRNYLLIGTIWGLGSGSNRLANTTLETFEQGKNCFDCHKAQHPIELNHMFGSTKPLSLP